MLTKARHKMYMINKLSLFGIGSSICALLALTACGQVDQPVGLVVFSDPAIAGALQGRLMADPDLASGNQANAVIAVRHVPALPIAGASDRLARRAREMARLELLEGGSVLDLPTASLSEETDHSFNGRTLLDLVQSTGAPKVCIDDLSPGFEWAAELDDAARLMPHAQVHTAAGVDSASCVLRAISYHTPAEASDALQYHYNRASRAGLVVELRGAQLPSLYARTNGETLSVYAQSKPNEMTTVDLIYWVEPSTND